MAERTAPHGTWVKLSQYLALEPAVGAAAGITFLMTAGEELWKRFVPKYLQVLGAPVMAVGFYGATRDLVDGVLQYPGGWLSDHLGRGRALRIFIAAAALGSLIVLAAPAWPVALAGLLLVMAWSSAASPTVFAIIGDALPSGRRTMGFAVQSTLRRLPIAVAPTLGGLLIVAMGVVGGVRAAIALAIPLAIVAFALASRVGGEAPASGECCHPAGAAVRAAASVGIGVPAGMSAVWRSMPRSLRRLLSSDILIRACESLVDVFVVLYATSVVGISAPQFGALVAVQMVTSIAVYLPAVALARRIGRKPLVIATFVAFSLFPLAVVAAASFAGLVGAFVVGGLREVGEPARKAVIVDLSDERLRGRTTGLYYLVRSLAITPAALVGGALWQVSPELPFVVAAAVGIAGTIVFAATVPASEAA